MNRIQFLPPAGSVGDPSANVHQARLSRGEVRGVRHTTFVPMHYEPNYAYPLLVWLHGPRQDERQLQRVMPQISMRNYVAIAPACPRNDGLDGWPHSETMIQRVEQAVFDCIQLAKERFHVAPQRVFLAGLQDAGTMAFRIGLRQPTCFAGLLSILGPFPQGQTPLLHLEQARRLPLFIAHGRDAVAYSEATTCEELRLFHAAGLNATLRQYPCGDAMTQHMLHDMDGWMMEQVTGAVDNT